MTHECQKERTGKCCGKCRQAQQSTIPVEVITETEQGVDQSDYQESDQDNGIVVYE